jgi:AraC-like DNA-binding protein
MSEELERGDGTGSSPGSVLTILDGMRGAGIDVEAVCAAAGFSIGDLETRETLVPPAQLGAMWREGTRLYGRGTVGIAVAMSAPLGRMILDYVASTSATLRQALEQVGRYHRLITRNGDLRLRPEGDLTVIELLVNLPPAAVPAPVVEYSMAAIVRRVVEFTSQKPCEVRFPHAPLGPREDYAHWLGVPTRFEAETAGVLFDDAALAAPCHGHDPNLFRFVKAHAELLLQNQSRDSTVRGQVRRLVVGLVAQGEPEVAAVARTLATSERSLQRRLQKEGTSFRDVVDDARKELALGYLGDRRLSVSEVAYLLGYAEAGAFVRAFKRWTGQTPGELRAGV